MKTTFSSRFLALVLGLMVGSNGHVLAQATMDASQYPTNLALLPGVGPTNHWSGLPAVWAQRHAQWAKTAQDDQGAVVFLGDSITQGWNSLAKDFPDLKVANRGIGGDTTRGVLYRLKADVLSLMPRGIVLLIGTNDIGNGATPKDVAKNIKEILKDIRREDPKIPVIVCEVMPSSEKQNRPADKIEAVNALIKKEMKGKDNVYVCDTWSIFADANGDCTPDIFHDLLHPNAVGYEKWTAALKPILVQADLEQAQ
jgi:lysophospholipase L1-like esterase